MTQLAQASMQIEKLRQQHYNATITTFDRIHDDLAILRLRPDDGPLSFEAGQYTVLGLGYWEPRMPDLQAETLRDEDQFRLARRAYSISCSMLDEFGHLTRATESLEVEFYVALVREAETPPALTPRLFMLQEGDRVHLGRKCHGHYTLNEVKPDDTVVFLATGTGEAPHNAMICELLSRPHRGKIVSVVCARYLADFAYLGTHGLLERMFNNYRYLTLTTRETRNLDRHHDNYVGSRHIQDYFASEDLEEDAGIEFYPESTHVFLCGNPSMIGVPLHTHDSSKRYPQPTGMVELLEKRGFRIDRPYDPGNVHFETYW